MPMDAAAMSARWAKSWPGTRPIAYELRSTRDRWVRLHTLTGSKRYPENEREYEQALGRANAVLDELMQPAASLLVVTVAWSDTSTPTARDHTLNHAVPEADLWTSLRPDDEDQSWWHLYVSEFKWSVGVLDPLLRLVAEAQTAGVIVTDQNMTWIAHPYAGGIDLLASSIDERNRLALRHAAWLSEHASGL